MAAANPAQRSGDNQKKHTWKGRIRDFYIFCIDDCNTILISGTQMSNACSQCTATAWDLEIIHVNSFSLNTNLWWHESSNTTTSARFVKK